MKFIHLADLHIGKNLGDFSLLDDQEFFLNEIVKIAKEKEVDGILLAGDIYDKAIPSEGAVRLFDSFITTLKEEKLMAFVISGNHDSDERLNFGSKLFEKSGIYFSAKYNGELYKRVIEDEYGKLNIYLLPFVKASQVKNYYADAEINSYNDAVKCVIDSANINTDERNILVAHQFVAGVSEEPKLSGSEGAATKNVGLVEKVGADIFDKFDYVALGHIHSAQKIIREEVRYSGSPIKYSLSEIDQKKSVPVITFGAKNNVDIELFEVKPLRDVRHIRGNLNDLLRDENIVDTDDYMYVTLTNEEFIENAIGIVKNTYKRTVKLDYDNSYTKEITNLDVSTVTSEKSFEELIQEFYSKMYSTSMSEEELIFMKEVAREAGVKDEAN